MSVDLDRIEEALKKESGKTLLVLLALSVPPLIAELRQSRSRLAALEQPQMTEDLVALTALAPAPIAQAGEATPDRFQEGAEAAIRVIEGGRFLHDEAPGARFAREVVTAIRRDLFLEPPAGTP